ncbi:unannotated protein [freshwater metagenome]|uniref:Unannotated protein n=1 Tax=freshwater metagenome TaxID=449393 RepID=A0A6J7JTR9_9ZZZZ
MAAPTTTQDPAGDVGEVVTTYPVTTEPPLSAGALQVRSTVVSWGVPVTVVGDPGTLRGVTAALSPPTSESPAAL